MGSAPCASTCKVGLVCNKSWSILVLLGTNSISLKVYLPAPVLYRLWAWCFSAICLTKDFRPAVGWPWQVYDGLFKLDLSMSEWLLLQKLWTFCHLESILNHVHVFCCFVSVKICDISWQWSESGYSASESKDATEVSTLATREGDRLSWSVHGLWFFGSLNVFNGAHCNSPILGKQSHLQDDLSSLIKYLQMCTSCFVSVKRARPKTCQVSVCLFRSKLLSNFHRALRIEEPPLPGKMLASISIGSCLWH